MSVDSNASFPILRLCSAVTNIYDLLWYPVQRSVVNEQWVAAESESITFFFTLMYLLGKIVWLKGTTRHRNVLTIQSAD